LVGDFCPSEDIIRSGETGFHLRRPLMTLAWMRCRIRCSDLLVSRSFSAEDFYVFGASGFHRIPSQVDLGRTLATHPPARLQRSSTNLQHVCSKGDSRVAPLMGFLSRLATSTSEPGSPEFASLSTFPSRAFSAPQGFASRWLLRLYFMPQPLIGFSPSEFSPRVTAATISGPLPS